FPVCARTWFYASPPCGRLADLCKIEDIAAASSATAKNPWSTIDETQPDGSDGAVHYLPQPKR
ncbi:MAG: hypothetical protein KGI48_10005, partial [Hyphomicrobiales bacterium]|nr:hypothetical protein [Hyphomicrobiales bacterium]